MALPIILALVIGQGQATQPFSTPFTIAEPNRIAATPKVDGILDDEEWDPLASTADMKSFFQWEPGKLHFAAKVPAGHDVIASFDMNANGWLQGRDNLEVRVSNANGKVAILCRVLDCTGIQGPQWHDFPGLAMSSRAAAISDGKITTYEVTLADSGIGAIEPTFGSKMMIRMDDPLSTDPQAAAYLPRILSPVTLVYERSAALPNGLKFNAEGTGRSCVAGEGTKIRLTFNGNDSMKLQRIEMHSEGYSHNDTNQLTVPFPKFDNKGRSYVDYETGIAETASEGFRVLKATLMTSDNIPAVMECSYRVGPVVDFDIPRKSIPIKPLDRSITFAYYVKSNSGKRVSGEITISVPEPLKILNGAERKIAIGSPRGNQRDKFDLFLPPNISGTFPVKFTSVVNGKHIDQTRYITIGDL